MSAEQDREFTDLVRRSVPASEEALRSLWMPIAAEFNRGGPDAVREYLSERQEQLQGTILNLLSEFEEN